MATGDGRPGTERRARGSRLFRDVIYLYVQPICDLVVMYVLLGQVPTFL